MPTPRSLRLRRLQRAALLLPIGFMAASCGSSDTAIALHVTNIPGSTTELRVAASIDGQSAMAPGSYAPPASGASDLRLGVRLINRTSGQASFDVAACNSACLLSRNSTKADLAQGNAEIDVALKSVPEALSLSLCTPRADLLCSMQWERNPATGEGTFTVHGSTFSSGAAVYLDGVKYPSPLITSPNRVELPSFPTLTKDQYVVEVQNADKTSILRRMSLGGLPLDVLPKAIELSQPPSQPDRMPYVVHLAIEDLDRDGNQDFVVVGAFFQNVFGVVPAKPGFLVPYYGDGKRGFVRGDAILNLPGVPRAITVASIKADAPPQLIVSLADVLTFGTTSYAVDYQLGGEIYILDPSGPRTYGAPIEVRPLPQFNGRSASQVLVTDVDGDNKKDLVVATTNARSLKNISAGAVLLWLQGPAATWQLSKLATDAPKTIVDRADTAPLAILPWDGPTGGEPGGLALALYNPNTARGELQILRSLTSATPTTASTQPMGGMSQQLFTGDFSGDGKRDLLVTLPIANDRQTAQRRIELFSQVSTGSSPAILDVQQPFGLAVAADLFADRREDLLLYTTKDSAPLLGVLPSRTVAPYLTQPAFHMPIRGAGQSLLAAGDLDRDGKPDIVSVTTGTLDLFAPLTGQIDIYFGR